MTVTVTGRRAGVTVTVTVTVAAVAIAAFIQRHPQRQRPAIRVDFKPLRRHRVENFHRQHHAAEFLRQRVQPPHSRPRLGRQTSQPSLLPRAQLGAGLQQKIPAGQFAATRQRAQNIGGHPPVAAADFQDVAAATVAIAATVATVVAIATVAEPGQHFRALPRQTSRGHIAQSRGGDEIAAGCRIAEFRQARLVVAEAGRV